MLDLGAYIKKHSFCQYFNAYIIVNGAKWPLSALKCCEPPKVSIVQSHFTRNACAITSWLLEVPHLRGLKKSVQKLAISPLEEIPHFHHFWRFPKSAWLWEAVEAKPLDKPQWKNQSHLEHARNQISLHSPVFTYSMLKHKHN